MYRQDVIAVAGPQSGSYLDIASGVPAWMEKTEQTVTAKTAMLLQF